MTSFRVRGTLDEAGFDLQSQAVGESARARLLRALDTPRLSQPVVHRSGTPFAARGLLEKISALAPALIEAGLDALASAAMGAPAFPIDAIYFDKHTRANWVVPGHQDRVMPVANDQGEAHRVAGGVGYADLDKETLASLLALRVHFDATDATRGALAVVPGSHLRGRLSDDHIRVVPLDSYRPCEAAAGDVLLMRPLLLHRSSPFQGEGQRRVLHVVYATRPPMPPFRWRTRAQATG